MSSAPGPALRSIGQGLRQALVPIAGLLARVATTLDRNRNLSYSQEGEDRVLTRFLDGRKAGFYVDVGAHHPVRFSNTYLFYERGWRGINVEPSPGAIEAFHSLRHRDINVRSGVAENSGELIYYVFDDPALNTFDRDLMREREAKTPYRVVATSTVKVERLDKILAAHLPEGQAIDFMSVDVEGFDLQVLRSNDWSRYRPELVLVEALDFSLQSPKQHPVHVFMISVGYELAAKTLNTLFYREAR
jgi:FkbM family methyltransferase